jgi:hypothetical protein
MINNIPAIEQEPSFIRKKRFKIPVLKFKTQEFVVLFCLEAVGD